MRARQIALLDVGVGGSGAPKGADQASMAARASAAKGAPAAASGSAAARSSTCGAGKSAIRCSRSV
ncbi:hypothetical protein BW737_001820 [Actinomyces ruminis]|uniref:Uncharacterized protein n=1 Tax=Actinomyces ruminis TaxID=1937003 RepID=A0ABX4MEG8_9ACTO|nr:hypothetical protein BW737_001820 [Actinomyces ruminis]